MSEGKSTASTRQKPVISSDPSFLSLEWLKPLSEGPVQFYSELFGFMAERLRAQADFLWGLADCESGRDLFSRQSKFVQDSWQSYAAEAQKAVSALQGKVNPTRPVK